MREKWIRVIRSISCFLFFLVLGFITLVNRQLFIEPLTDWVHGRATFQELVDIIQDEFVGKDVWQRNMFINLNGAFARMTGRTNYNDVQLMNNGMLTYGTIEEPDLSVLMENIMRMQNFLKQRGIPFFFIMAPFKVPIEGEVFPIGVNQYSNQYADTFMKMLSLKQVNTLDLRTEISKSIADVEKYFYRTDHHWNTDGAFFAYQLVMRYLHETIPIIEGTYTDKELWTRYELPDWWLGSHGKRVGSHFASIDNLIYYLPNFETNMSLAIPRHDLYYVGTFMDANVREKYLVEKDFFKHNSYCAYIGGDYPLALHRNPDAPNKEKVLLIKDSFMLPLEAFISTEFSEVMVIDPRYYKESGIGNYIEWTKPNIVIMMINPSVLSGQDYTDFHFDNITEQTKKRIAEYSSIEIAGSIDKNNYYEIPLVLEADKVYTITIESIEPIIGETKGVSVQLYDFDEQERIDGTIFDIEYGIENGYEWTFMVPERDTRMGVLLFAGINNQTQGNILDFQNIQIYQ